MSQALVTVEHLSKSYRKGQFAVEDISFRIPAGRIVGLLGPNGCGKTSTIKMLNGLLRPTKGKILIQGEPLSAASHAAIAYMPDRNFLDPVIKVNEAVTLFSDFFADFNIDKANRILAEMDIDPTLRLRELSKGTLEKVQLALVMGREAKLYILDEPIGGVDPAARELILRKIFENYSEDAAILISTHLISEIENYLDDIILMRDGHILLQESTDSLREKSGESINSYFIKTFGER